MSYLEPRLCHKVTQTRWLATEDIPMAQLATAAVSTPSPTQYALGLVNTLPDSAHASIGLALGWDFAHHGLTPPVEHLFASSALRQGWHVGAATYGHRTLRARRHTQQWLLLRTYAWSRGRSFESVQLTPNYLQQLDVTHCPITRAALNELRGDGCARSIDRVRDDAGYAAGNLVVMSRAANAAKASHDHGSANALALSLAGGPVQQIAGLDPLAWQRIAVLTSFVTELPHAEAALIPMTVLPPNRLRLFNPIQALQALVTRQFATPGWSQRLARIEALLPNEELRGDFNRFVMAIAPRALALKASQPAIHIRWALEDAWIQPLVQKRWACFARRLTATQAERLVLHSAAKRLSTVHVQTHDSAASTDGWALAQQGYTPRLEGLPPPNAVTPRSYVNQILLT